MQITDFVLIALAIAAPVRSSVLARVKGEIPDTVPAKGVKIEEAVSYNNHSLSLVPRVGPEIVACYNSGTAMDRAPIIAAIDSWCGRMIGTRVTNGQIVSELYPVDALSSILLSAKAINGCNFVIDGNCNRLLRLPVDKCNTNGENGKQGGVETDSCGQWRVDPGCCGPWASDN